MKPVYILVHEDVVLSSAAAPLDILTRTNDILQAADRPPAFDVAPVGRQSDTIDLELPASFRCRLTLDAVPAKSAGHRQSLILVPAFSGEWEQVRERNRAAIEWLGRHYRAGTEVASLCLGSYFLAEAGLLDGKPCTSHWRAIEDMRLRFPKVDFQPDSVVTDQSGIYTGGGAFTSLNLVLYLVEKFCGHEIGVHVAKNFSIHRDHINQFFGVPRPESARRSGDPRRAGVYRGALCRRRQRRARRRPCKHEQAQLYSPLQAGASNHAAGIHSESQNRGCEESA